MEIDWSVGRDSRNARSELDLDENTLVIFTSDNGPWLTYGEPRRLGGPLREGKGTMFDGGVRVPCIMRWPGRIPAGKTCREMALHHRHPADDRRRWPALPRPQSDRRAEHLAADRRLRQGQEIRPGACSSTTENELQAMRAGKWKLQFPHAYNSLTGTPGRDGRPGGYTQARCGLELYDLEKDLGERRTTSLTATPMWSSRLQALAEKAPATTWATATAPVAKSGPAAKSRPRARTPDLF